MKDKEKQIEEMANDICSKTPQECVSMGGRCNCLINERALEKLYNAGYRKLSEDSVVLSKEEYERLQETIVDLKCDKLELKNEISEKDNKIALLEETVDCIKFNVDFTRKETAEKITSIVDKVCEKHTEYAINKIKYRSAEELYCSAVKSFVESFKKELAKQFGVEIKE